MLVLLYIVLIYLASVLIAFGLVYWGDYEYRRKCETLYDFLFELPLGCDMANIFILVPMVGFVYSVIIAIRGAIHRISDWSKTIKL